MPLLVCKLVNGEWIPVCKCWNLYDAQLTCQMLQIGSRERYQVFRTK